MEPKVNSSASLTEEIYGQIREDLIACRFRPGERLKAKDLSLALHVSLGVVREALSRLTAEGFVQAQPQRGFRAGPLSAIELMQLSEATIMVEGFCLRRSIEIGDLDWETRVTAAHYRFTNTPLCDEADPSRISKTFTTAHSEFRRALVSACDNQWMLRLQEMLHSQSERYRQICMMQGPKLVDYRDGYPVLVQAVLKRDADKAVALLSQRLKANALRMRDAFTHSNVLGSASPHAAAKRLSRRNMAGGASRNV
jgi:DNA-binding GntR family transcriptional regulator